MNNVLNLVTPSHPLTHKNKLTKEQKEEKEKERKEKKRKK